MSASPATTTIDIESQLAAPSRAATRWWLIPSLALAILFLLAVLTVAVVAWRMRQQHHAAVLAVENAVARAQAAGEPVTIEDLYAFHALPSGVTDTTRLWQFALQSFDPKQFTADGKDLPCVGAGDPIKLLPDAADSQLAAAEAFLQKYDNTLTATFAAARADGECRFPVQFEKGWATLLPHVQKLRDLAQLLELNLRVRAARGDIDGAVESLHAMLAVSRSLDNQLLLVEHLVRVRLAGVASAEAEWLINQKQLTDEQLAQLQAHFQALDLHGGLTRGLTGERAMGYNTFYHLSTLKNAGIKLPKEADIPLMFEADGQLARPADCLLQFELLTDTLTASSEPFPQARKRVELVEQRLKKAAGSKNPLERVKYMVTLLVTPAILPAFDSTARGLAKQQALEAALAAERYRLKSGSFPSQLSDLVPDLLAAVPTDPFDGQPLRLINRDGALIIYSVGPNGKDNGGQSGTRPNEPDIVVRIQAKKESSP
jgi:hypothetical protein